MMTSGQPSGIESRHALLHGPKGAIQQVTRMLSATLVSRGITVNTVNPGPTDTGWATEDTHPCVLQRMPLGWG